MNFRHLLTATTATAFVGALSMPAQAANLFGNTGIQFDTATTVDFNFVQASNQFQSVLNIYTQAAPLNPVASLFTETKQSDTKLQSDNWVSTCGGANSAVANCTSSFTFQAGVLYTLGLFSVAVTPSGTLDPNNGPRVPIVYSTNSLNAPYTVGGVTSNKRANFSSNNPFLNTVNIFFEDAAYRTEPEDLDFNDFQISASARPVPVPPMLGGLMVLGALLLYRRHRQQLAESKAK